MPRTTASHRLAGALLAAALLTPLAGCSTQPASARGPDRPDAASTAGTVPAAQIDPGRMQPPDPKRPVVSLDVHVAADLKSVTGTETVDFTPDDQVCQIALREWVNGPAIASNGSSMTLSTVTVNGDRRPVMFLPGGAQAGTQGTIVVIPLVDCATAGTRLHLTAQYSVTAGQGGGTERVGVDSGGRVLRLGSAFPMLAWVRGRDWVLEPALPGKGEEEVSEEFRLARLAVTAPSDVQVVGAGTPGPVTQQGGQTVSTFTADSVRDVAFAVGRFTTTTLHVDGLTIHAAVPQGSVASAAVWARTAAHSAQAEQDLFGPLPYPDVWLIVCLPDMMGIEFPGTMFYSDVDPVSADRLVPHEWGHQYFYSLVGDDQGRDPWLDEAFATYAESLVNGDEARYLAQTAGPSVAGHVGAPMSYWQGPDQDDRYNQGVYVQGAAALIRARDAVGAAAFDRAIRRLINTNAHRVEQPSDVAAALRGLPRAIAVLRRAGALP